MAWLFLGAWLFMEGLSRLGATVWAKEVLQAICLTVAGLLFMLGVFWPFAS